jgi:hypothetical protein
MPPPPPLLALSSLAERSWFGLTQALATAFVEAASVCLAEVGKPEEAPLVLRREDGTQTIRQCRRLEVTPAMQAAHDDLYEAAERGATAIGILLTSNELGYEVVRRARKGRGFDYWISQSPSAPQPFQALLEVSGILSNPLAVEARAKQKREQAGVYDAPGYPVVVAVTEFSTPVVLLEHHP